MTSRPSLVDVLRRERDDALELLGGVIVERENLKAALWKIADGHTSGGLSDDEHPQLVARDALAGLSQPTMCDPNWDGRAR